MSDLSGRSGSLQAAIAWRASESVRMPGRTEMRQAVGGGLLALGLGTAAMGLVGCGGADDQKAFVVALEADDTPGSILERSVIQASEMCLEDDKLVLVRWKFDEGDVEKPVVQQYLKSEPKFPVYVECQAVRKSQTAP
jgi:hypothetical protein